LDAASMEATRAAGAAQLGIHGLASKERPPRGKPGVTIASSVAKAAEWAARAAAAPPGDSVDATLEAFTWAQDAADAARAPKILTDLESDLLGLWQAANRGRWTNQTPVPPSVFDALDGQDSMR